VTFAEAWDVLDAADQVARAHGWACWPVLTPKMLHIELERGRRWRVVVLTQQQVEACADVAALRALVDLEVPRVLADRSATA
jgi:hypothetical protein